MKLDLGSFEELVRATRCCRRFDESRVVEPELLLQLVDIARQVSSGGNRQPLRYRLVTDEAACASIFEELTWAAALRDWPGPEPGERPHAYVIICDASGGVTTPVDEGIAAQTLLMGATVLGLSGCMIHAFRAAALSEALELPQDVRPLMVLALGYGKEEIVLDTFDHAPDGAPYWRDEQQVHHVPKRELKDVLL